MSADPVVSYWQSFCIGIPAPPPALKDVAIIISCCNAASTIGAVLADFRAAIPHAKIYVVDNNSSDETSHIAQGEGAIVRVAKGKVEDSSISRMFADIVADCYILVDGDDTYDPTVASNLVDMVIRDGFDLVNVARASTSGDKTQSRDLGNSLLSGIVALFFGRETVDILSGYKALSFRFVKSFPAMSHGIKMGITLHALELQLPHAEIIGSHRARPAERASALSINRNFTKVIFLLCRLIKYEQPLPFFGGVGIIVCLVGVLIGFPIVATFSATGLGTRLPTLVLSIGLEMFGSLSFVVGLFLDALKTLRREMRRFAYNSVPLRQRSDLQQDP